MKRTFTYIALISLLNNLSSSPVQSQQKDSSLVLAEQTVIAYFQAIKQRQYDTLVYFYDPQALSEFKHYLVQIDKAILVPNKRAEFRKVYGIAESVPDIAALDSVSVFNMFMRSIGPLLNPENCSYGDVTILGSASEGLDTIHVFSKIMFTLYGQSGSNTETVTLRRSLKTCGLVLTDRWRMMLESELATVKRSRGED